MGRPLEPGLIRIFRYFALVAMIYFAILWGYGNYAQPPNLVLQVQSMMNLMTNVSLFIFLSLPWLEKTMKRWYLPFALVAYTSATVFSNLIYLIDPHAELSMIIARSWALVPILLVPLVLIAWQYSFFSVMVFVIFTNAIELLILFRAIGIINFETLPILGLPVIKAFAFGMVGFIVKRLMDTQRAQKRQLILANIRLGQQAKTLEQLAASRERNRLARELHDTLAHTLSGLAVNLEAVKATLNPEEEEINTMIDRSLVVTRTGLDETRRVLQDLRARPLEDLGLELAIQQLAKTTAERENIVITTTIADNLPTLPSDVEQSFYRITGEALKNIAKHAQARHVFIELNFHDNSVDLLIRDDGRGFNVKKASATDQYGVKGMEERAAIVGGMLNVESEPGLGTRVRFTWERLDDQSINL